MPVALAAGLVLAGHLAAGALAFWLLRAPTEVPRPVVLIGSPAVGREVQVGQPVPVHATARGEERIVRVELWVDGVLDQVQASNIPEGISPFPLVSWWQPATPGPHTLIARAFNAADGHAHASLSMEAVESSGGLAGDTGNPPDEPGSSPAGGSPGAGVGGVPDAPDPGHQELEPPESGTCLDSDGDEVCDEVDLCPGEAGLPWNAGCRETGAGDRDGDGVVDDVDLAPDEAGLPEHGGAPPPGEGADLDGDTVPEDEEAPSLLSPLYRLYWLRRPDLPSSER